MLFRGGSLSAVDPSLGLYNKNDTGSPQPMLFILAGPLILTLAADIYTPMIAAPTGTSPNWSYNKKKTALIYIDELVQERRNSSAMAMELRLSFTSPSI